VPPDIHSTEDVEMDVTELAKGNMCSAKQGEDHIEAMLNATERRDTQTNGSAATPSSAPLEPVLRTFGTWSTVDHKSETQVQGWKDVVDDIFSTFKRSPMGSSSSANPLEFAQKVTGMCTDHAADQKKLARLVEEWKRDADRELRGEKEMLARGDAEIIGAVAKAWGEILAEVGGLESWESLSKERQDQLLESIVHKVRVMFGEEAYEKLTPAEKRRANLFIWTGCAMHKDLNSTKGGAEAMAESWEEGEAPAKLMNKHNVAAAATGSIELEKRAADDSEGGAVKLTKLVGALVRHKDAKKGHQDIFRIFCLGKLDREIYFPDTSNIRYGSHCDAAIEICVHHDLYIDFLDSFIRNSKERAGLNNLENNVLIGLNDIPTMTEACVLGLYAQAISHPYMRRVRVPETYLVNHLDLGPFHDRLLKHLRNVIADPDLLLGLQVSSTTGALDGLPWESLEFMEHVSVHQKKYPHLRRTLIGFFEGALETWERFTPEFRMDSDAMNTTDEEKLLAFRSPTNDINESQLGIKRQMARLAPNMTEHQFNARLLFGRNNVDDVTDFLSAELRQFARGEARAIDRSKASRTQRQRLATVKIKISKEKERTREASQQQAAKRLERLKASNPTLDLEKLRGTPYCDLRVDGLREQLRWHQQIDGDEGIPKAISGLRKADLVREVFAAVERRTQRNVPNGTFFVLWVVGTHLIENMIGPIPSVSQADCDSMAVDSQANDPTILNVAIIGDVTASPIDDNQPLFEAGCVWTENDYSCAYDATFMAFFSTYRRSSLLWQECWRAESTINGFLAERFTWISEGFASDLDFFTLSARFSEYQDDFRDWMFAVNRQKFPRRGKCLAAVADILEYFCGQHNHSMNLENTLSCSNQTCPPTVHTRSFAVMCLPTATRGFGNAHNAIGVQSVVTRELASLLGQQLTSKCGRCSGDHIQSIWSMAALTWIWFEIYPNVSVLPSLALTFDQFGEPRTFTLTAVVYLGGAHFTARWRDHLGVWWKHDGRKHHGSPVVDVINSESDLCECNGRRMCYLIYSFEHDI
jgi:hypothetical protein